MSGFEDSNVVRLYANLVKRLLEVSDPKISERNRRWHKEPEYRSYGISSTDFKELLNEYRSRFKALCLEEKIELAGRLYKSGISTEASIGNHLLESNTASLNPSHFPVFEEFFDHYNNWATTDWFCIRVLQPLLSRYPTEVIGLLRGWNQSENMWKRRASVVTFTRKVALSGEYIDTSLDFCDKLIWDEEDLVRKAVGWTLKDNMRYDKKRVLGYVKDLRRKGVSSTITLYAIRDLKGEEREEVLCIKPSKKKQY